MAALKLELCLARWQGAGSPRKFPKINVPPLNKWLRRIKNMYKSEQYFVSMPKKHIFLQKGSSTLDDISLQNVIAHPAAFFVFYVFNNNILGLQKTSKIQFRWSYKMIWHLKTLTTWTLENL